LQVEEFALFEGEVAGGVGGEFAVSEDEGGFEGVFKVEVAVTGEVGAVGVFQGLGIKGGFLGLVVFEGVGGVKEGLDGFDFDIGELEVLGGVLNGEELVKVGAFFDPVLGLLQDLAVGGVGDALGE